MKLAKMLVLLAAGAILAIPGPALSKSANKDIAYVGGAAMLTSKDIIDNAVNSPIHTTLVAAVKAADLVSTLKGPGPFTVFAPTDDAFKALPEGTVANLLKPENKDQLKSVLTYHVLSGKVSAEELAKLIKAGNGSADLKTVEGEDITAMLKGKNIELKDSKGGIATITQSDVNQSNGVIHVIDKVLLP